MRLLAMACRGGLWQINVATKASVDSSQIVNELQEYVTWTQAAGAALTWTPMLIESGTPWREALAYCTRIREAGTQVLPQVLAMPLYISLRFDQPQSFHLLIQGWQPVFGDWARIDHATRISRLRDVAARDILRSAGIRGRRYFEVRFDRWEIARSPSRPDMIGRCLLELAQRGADPVDAFCDLLLQDDLATLVRLPIANDDPSEMAEALNSDGVLYGLGDAGAHVSSVTNFAYPTAVLSNFVRERGTLTVEKAVREMTSVPARVMGLSDRGELSSGKAADICVVDPQCVALAPAETRADLPGGVERIYQGAVGYRAVVVNGRVTVRNDVSLNIAAGRFLRRR
jgi:N-acyl-D-aspartate/D-glutamate deacylase